MSRTATRAFDLFETIVRSPVPMGLMDVVDATDIDKSTAQRLLGFLVDRELLTRMPPSATCSDPRRSRWRLPSAPAATCAESSRRPCASCATPAARPSACTWPSATARVRRRAGEHRRHPSGRADRRDSSPSTSAPPARRSSRSSPRRGSTTCSPRPTSSAPTARKSATTSSASGSRATCSPRATAPRASARSPLPSSTRTGSPRRSPSPARASASPPPPPRRSALASRSHRRHLPNPRRPPTMTALPHIDAVRPRWRPAQTRETRFASRPAPHQHRPRRRCRRLAQACGAPHGRRGPRDGDDLRPAVGARQSRRTRRHRRRPRCRRRPELAGIVLPKVESAGDVVKVDWYITALERARGLEADRSASWRTSSSLRGWSTRRSRRGELASGVPHLRGGRLLAGCRSGLAVRRRPEPLVLAAKQRLVLASRSAGLLPPHDGVYPCSAITKDCARRPSRLAASACSASTPCTPGRSPWIDEVFTPSAERLSRAREIIEAFDASESGGVGNIDVDGQFIDYPVAHRAQALLELAAGLRTAS